MQTCWWQGLCVLLAGALFWLVTRKKDSLDSDQLSLKKDFLALSSFGLLAGMMYFAGNQLAFSNFPKDVAAILAQGEVPAVMIIEGQMDKTKRLTLLQWLGALLTIGSACVMGL